jgi:peptidoglycan/LPS O-acetylase OafA/YrhL
MVFVHHAPPVPLPGYASDFGAVGVDLFLCISAYLITRLILFEHDQTGNFCLRSFFIRRALRIWPLYYAYATLACVFAVLLADLEPVKAGAWWLSHLSFSNNVMTAAQGYSPVPAAAHLWTIALEEQAYLLMPLVLTAFLAGGASSRRACQFCIGAILVLVVARTGLVLSGTEHPFIWVLPLRADAFLLGALAAVMTRHQEPKRHQLMFWGGLLLLALVLISLPLRGGAYQIMGYPLVAVGFTAILLSTVGCKSAAAGILGSAPARYLGKISYGIYVYHLAAILVVGRIAEGREWHAPWLVSAVAFAFTLALAAASYRFLERPFLLLKDRYTRVASRPL